MPAFYRVHKKNKPLKGFYTVVDEFDFEGKNHPGPSRDEILMSKFENRDKFKSWDYYYGFSSRKQLAKWFHCKEFYRIAKDYKLVVSKWNVPKSEMFRGDTQTVVKREWFEANRRNCFTVDPDFENNKLTSL